MPRFSPGRLTIGSLFSGIGGLDIAVEWATGSSVAWQLDLTGADIRRRHWPDARQIEADIQVVDVRALPPANILVAGFPCQNFSAARSAWRAALSHDDRYKLFRRTVAVVEELRPQAVILENVPQAFTDGTVLAALAAAGYRTASATVAAADIGLPHVRSRTFVVAVLGDAPHVTISVPPRSDVPNERLWPTPVGRDHKSGESLSTAASSYRRGGQGGTRLNPVWVERLMGFPEGWTEPTGPMLVPDEFTFPRVRGRYPTTWDRSVPWPGLPDEPPRTLPPGPRVLGRAARLQALGNAVCPQQGAHAIRALWSFCQTFEFPPTPEVIS